MVLFQHHPDGHLYKCIDLLQASAYNITAAPPLHALMQHSVMLSAPTLQTRFVPFYYMVNNLLAQVEACKLNT